MPIQPINNIHTKPKTYRPNYVKISGYGSLAFGIGSIIAATQHKMKTHKTLAYIASALALGHVGLIEFNHYKYKHKKNGWK